MLYCTVQQIKIRSSEFCVQWIVDLVITDAQSNLPQGVVRVCLGPGLGGVPDGSVAMANVSGT